MNNDAKDRECIALVSTRGGEEPASTPGPLLVDARARLGVVIDDTRLFNTSLKEHASLKGEATLSSLDGYLDLTLTADGLGHISVVGEGWDRPRVGSHLILSYETDQTALSPLQAEVTSLATYFSRTR
jgi:hypothetical protein